MADPVSAALGIASSIVALIEATDRLVRYVRDFAEAPTAIQKLKLSLENLTTLLKKLKDHCDNAPSDAPWLQGLWKIQKVEKDGKNIEEESGVLAELQQTINKLTNLLNPSKSWKRTGAWQRPTWHSKRKSVDEVQADIQRYLVVINAFLALKNDQTSSEILQLMKTDREVVKSQYAMMNDRLSMFETAQREDVDRRKRDYDESERLEIIRWLSPLSFLAKQKELYADCFPETGDWLLQDQRFQFWAEQAHLWYLQCVGEPMIGKTVLTSILTHHLSSKGHKPPVVLSVYLDYKAATVQTIFNIMGSLLKQLIQLDELRPISDDLRILFKKAKRLELSPSSYDSEVRKILISELDRYDRFYVVVDGFDELQPGARIKLRRELRNLLPNKSSLIFMTRQIEGEIEIAGRTDCDRCNKQDIKIFFRCPVCDDGNYDVCLDCQRQGFGCKEATHKLSEPYGRREIQVNIPDKDIENYVRREIGAELTDENPVLVDERSAREDRPDMTRFHSLVQRDPNLPDQIVSTIVKKANGRFLFARLYLDLLKKAPNARLLRKILSSFPEDTSEIYRESMRRIERQDKEDRLRALRVLGFITRTRRPLTMKALQHALAAMEFDDDEDVTAADILDSITPVNVILEITSGLVITEDNGQDKDMKLVHRTLEDYLLLEESRREWFPSADSEIAQGCLRYLNLVIPHGAGEDDDWESMNIEYPFLQYASQYWGDHVRDANCNTSANFDLQKRTMLFMDDQYSACLHAAWATNFGGHDTWDVRKNVDKLHVYAWYGLSFAITTIDRDKSTVDVIEPSYGQTALMFACRKGHPEVVRQLLDLGASARKISARGRTAMFEAILGQQEEVVELLTELVPPDLDINGANPKQFSRTALMLAVRLDCLEMVHMLLRYPGINIDLQDANGMTALYLAAKYDHLQMVELLLAAGANVNIGDSKAGRIPLRIAAERDHVNIVETLLQFGAQTDSKDRSGGTPILYAVMHGAEKSLKKLIAVGADLRVVDADAQSLLDCASKNDHSRIARILIEEGLSPNFGRPMHLASQYGRSTTLSLLLEKNADPTLQDRFGRNPKQVAWQYGQSEIINLLNEFERNQLIRQPEGISDDAQLPIWAMVRQGLAELLAEAMTTRKTDLEVLEPFSDNTALHCAIEAHEPEILLSLLEISAISIDAPNRWLRTPLHSAARLGDLNAVGILLEYEADLDVKDRWGDEPLVLAQSNWHWDVMLTLIKAGASIDKLKINVEKLFFVAVEEGDTEAAQVLLSEGVDRWAQNAEGLRALQIAAAMGDEPMRQVLLRAPTIAFRAPEVEIIGKESHRARNGEGSPKRSAGAANAIPFRSRPGQS